MLMKNAVKLTEQYSEVLEWFQTDMQMRKYNNTQMDTQTKKSPDLR